LDMLGNHYSLRHDVRASVIFQEIGTNTNFGNTA